jgi:hypothetical protein
MLQDFRDSGQVWTEQHQIGNMIANYSTKMLEGDFDDDNDDDIIIM